MNAKKPRYTDARDVWFWALLLLAVVTSPCWFPVMLLIADVIFRLLTGEALIPPLAP